MSAIKNSSKLPSSALGYAIAFMLLIGMVATGILFISSTNKRLERHYALKENMLMNNYLSILHGARSSEDGTQQLIHASGDTTLITRKTWGAYRVIVANTHHPSGEVNRSTLIGYETEDAYPALYLPERKQALKLCGDTKLEGTVIIGERGLERGYIAGKNYENDKLLYGTQKKSERSLPALLTSLKQENIAKYRENTLKIDFFSNDTTFSFAEQTRLISQIKPLYIANSITGNCILHSFDSIIVSSTAHLQNVILIAPAIRFESEFSGAVQAIAHKQIRCGKNVLLEYPSILVLNEQSGNEVDRQHGIFLEEGTKVIGGILLFSQKPNFRKPVFLDIDHAIVGGLIYNQGSTQLKGKVIGHLYTEKFDLKAGGGRYSNFLLDASISSELVPEEMVMPNWLVDQKRTKPTIITCF